MRQTDTNVVVTKVPAVESGAVAHSYPNNSLGEPKRVISATFSGLRMLRETFRV